MTEVAATATNTDPEHAAAGAGADDAPAERLFSRSVVISGIRCTLTYVIFPFVAPLIGIAASVGAVIGVLIGVVAIVFNVMSIRRFFKAQTPISLPILIKFK